MSISEQVKELREHGQIHKHNSRYTVDLLNQAADTIESLSAKLQAADMEQSEKYCEDDIFRKIISELDERIGTQLKIIAGLNDEVYRYGYGKSIEAYQQSKLIVEQNVDKYKEKRSTEDRSIKYRQ